MTADSKLRANNVMRFAFSVDRQIAASLVWTWWNSEDIEQL